jgi:hypothetical protein
MMVYGYARVRPGRFWQRQKERLLAAGVERVFTRRCRGWPPSRRNCRFLHQLAALLDQPLRLIWQGVAVAGVAASRRFVKQKYLNFRLVLLPLVS